ncbi:DNA-3-methyladenine glycosylase family protein [Ruicaihuangia caeni]|uniref:DNA-3-methyladenine glycosylase 2 family protein n=1 Tax=Ruicaihuangia caeni TaxID=3042517 RepID=A0AAW6TAZ1_9MICO|nr:DNA-3-methyladenine glycosylase 2 family protein [Klugiella sp. YN-L-19]MDI2098988.1 DNA-3-methyladenine glycosylase 2 family protein [Klugiella sp. YN-L-19]
MLQTTYAPRVPVDLRQTLGPVGRGPADPTLRWEGSNAWMTMRFDGPDAAAETAAATLHLAPRRDGIRVTAWGPAAERALAAVPRLLGADDNWSELALDSHPKLREVHRQNQGLRLARTDRLFPALVCAVLEQKVTSIEALRAWRQLVTRYGERAPGPAPLGMRVVPRAVTWRRIPSWEWHRAGVGPQRSATVLRVAEVAASVERLVGMDAETAAAKLKSVRGIGVWTAAEALQRSHGAPDHVSVGDYHLAAYVGWALAGRPVDDDGMLELLEPWRGHRQRIVRLIVASGFRKPSFGPRMTIEDHRAH